MKIKIIVPSKIHLLGEHAVVYGKPAILTSVGLYCYINLSPRSDTKINIISDQINQNIDTTVDDIFEISHNFRNLWRKFSMNNDTKILKSIIKSPVDYLLASIGETLSYYNVRKIPGFDLHIESQIPIGSGIGSSAAVGSGIAGALSLLLDKGIDKSVLNDITYNIEKLRHGFPSGSDPATVINGGLIWFRKELSDFRIIEPLPFALSLNISSSCLLIDTGKPNESTGEMVSAVRSLFIKNQTGTQKILDSQEKLVRDLYLTLKDDDLNKTIDIFRLGESNLEKLGVVSPSVQKLIRDIEISGGAAKICGGGGKTSGTGIILAIHKNKNKIKTISEKFGYKYFDAKLGVSGIQFQS
jgi:mevalonate kinase